MAQIDEIKEYLSKLQMVLKRADFNLFGYSFVKRNRVDDLMCCIMAVLPKQFKAILTYKTEMHKFVSTLNFSMLKKEMMRPFFFSKDLYIYELNKVLIYIQNITRSIEKDIEKIEKL